MRRQGEAVEKEECRQFLEESEIAITITQPPTKIWFFEGNFWGKMRKTITSIPKILTNQKLSLCKTIADTASDLSKAGRQEAKNYRKSTSKYRLCNAMQRNATQHKQTNCMDPNRISQYKLFIKRVDKIWLIWNFS